ncbi:MAG: L,D-transpeptidase [Candidatus Kapaibacteriota bacterium]
MASRIFSSTTKTFVLSNWRHFIKETNSVVFYFIPLKDTLYFLGYDYIEINLKSQLAFHITRSGDTDTVKISSGNKYLSKAIETPTGLFAVQNKAPIQISRQFENAEMLNWIGFNGNIGFHGLKKTGYYSHLGRRPSSHGCVRMSNEDGVRWYQKIKNGTPVLVYHSNPIRILKFADYKEFNPEKDVVITTGNKGFYKFLNFRLDNILKGEHFRKNRGKVFLARTLRIPNSTIEIETRKELPFYQQPKLMQDKNHQTDFVSTFVFVDFKYISDTCELK